MLQHAASLFGVKVWTPGHATAPQRRRGTRQSLPQTRDEVECSPDGNKNLFKLNMLTFRMII